MLNIKGGYVEVFTGPMFSGKSNAIIQQVKREAFAKRKYLVFKPMMDNRDSANQIVSRTGLAIDTFVVENKNQVLDIVNTSKDIDLIAFDEAQFFSVEMANVISELANMGYRVIVAGLNLDFNANPFKTMRKIIMNAEIVHKLYAVCFECGNDASFSHRIIDNNDKFVVGSDEYVALCRDCYNKAINERKGK